MSNIDMLPMGWQTVVVVYSKIFQRPRCQPVNPEWVWWLFDRILLFESTLYVLIKSRLRDRLDHLQTFFFASFLNPFAASKQNLEKLILKSQPLHLKSYFFYSFFFHQNCEMWSASVFRIKFKMFLQAFFVFQGTFYFFQKINFNLNFVSLFELEHIFECAPPKSASKIKPEKSLQILSAQNSSLVFS